MSEMRPPITIFCSGVVLLVSITISVANPLVDKVYALLDPRVRAR